MEVGSRSIVEEGGEWDLLLQKDGFCYNHGDVACLLRWRLWDGLWAFFSSFFSSSSSFHSSPFNLSSFALLPSFPHFSPLCLFLLT